MKRIISVLAVGVCLLATVRANSCLCSSAEVLTACKNPCEPTCSEPNKIPCPTFTCSFGCACKDGTLRDEITGQCVPPQYCSVCPANEVPNDYKTCEPTCQKQNLFQCIFQVKKCICQPGFLRDLSSGKCVHADCCPKECGVDEEWSSCVKPKKTCKTITEIVQCPKNCTPGCNCKAGFVWDKETKKCIPEANCPGECGINEEWGNCSDVLCRSTCQHPGPTACRMMCKPGCSCKDGYIWDEYKKQCVLKKDCPKFCDGVHQEWNNCSDIHCRPTCQHPAPKACIMMCRPGCSCKDGYIWDENKNECVLKKDCPKLCDHPHQEWKNCSNIHCRPTCQHRGPKVCTMQCTPGCSCKEGYLWDEDKKECVFEKDCPKFCEGEHQEWKHCSDKDCRSTCRHPWSKPCPKICTPGCSCKEGYIWDEDKKKCVLKKDCPKFCDGEHQEWRQCSDVNCRETCQIAYPMLCNMVCIPGCSCIDGYIWDEHYKKCVPRGKCSKVCNSNAIWVDFITHKPPTCHSLIEHKLNEDQYSKSGCTCKSGYVWDEFSRNCVLPNNCLRVKWEI